MPQLSDSHTTTLCLQPDVGESSERASAALDERLELACFVRLPEHVAAPHKLAPHVQLRNGRPTRVLLDSFSKIIVLQDVT